MTYVLYCGSCGTQLWLTYRDKLVPPCVNCGGALSMNAEPACEKCGGRSWDHGVEHHLIWD
jgi:5-methylcytosine-specific restriction endonuclease McrA